MLSRYYASSATFSLNGGLLALGARDSLGQLLHGMQVCVRACLSALAWLEVRWLGCGAAKLGALAWLRGCQALECAAPHTRHLLP
jgi:hypothetical protein